MKAKTQSMHERRIMPPIPRLRKVSQLRYVKTEIKKKGGRKELGWVYGRVVRVKPEVPK